MAAKKKAKKGADKKDKKSKASTAKKADKKKISSSSKISKSAQKAKVKKAVKKVSANKKKTSASKSSKKPSKSAVKLKTTPKKLRTVSKKNIKKAAKKASPSKAKVTKAKSVKSKKVTSKKINKPASVSKKSVTKTTSKSTARKGKMTKADAARSISQSTEIKSTQSSSIQKEKRKETNSISNEPITIEKVMEETNENNVLPHSLKPAEHTTFTDSLSDDISSVYARTTDDIPEPPGKYSLEYNCRTAPELLYKFLTDPVELAEWFCDDVNVRNGIYTFVWNGVPQQARLIKQERNQLVRFQWVDKNDGSYFEFSIHKNPLTGDVTLYVTDFSSPEELETNKIWWNNQIQKLKNILGLQY
ncbi:MAG: START-like domain-containing protein [Bacteroidota bacterium]